MAKILEELFGLSGRVAIVTGAAAGIGAEIARVMAAAGAAVTIADIDGPAAERRAEALSGGTGAVVAVPTDMADPAAVSVLFERTLERFGRVDILVNNAGIYPKYPLLEITPEQWDRVHDINLRGAFFAMQAALRVMGPAGRGGRIINISSVASIHPATFGNAHYSAAKAGVNAMTKAAAMEVAADGITVNAILPGPIGTGGPHRPPSPDELTPVGPAADSRRWISGRMGKPLELASAVLFLASPAAGYITGHTLVVDGGFMVS